MKRWTNTVEKRSNVHQMFNIFFFGHQKFFLLYSEPCKPFISYCNRYWLCFCSQYRKWNKEVELNEKLFCKNPLHNKICYSVNPIYTVNCVRSWFFCTWKLTIHGLNRLGMGFRAKHNNRVDIDWREIVAIKFEIPWIFYSFRFLIKRK